MDNHGDTALLLQSCLRLYRDAGIPCQLIEPTEDIPYLSLVLSFELIQQASHTIQVEMNFIPGLDSAKEGIHILQIFVSTLKMGESGTSCNADPLYLADLYRIVNRINVNLPLGAFGIMEEASLIFYKINCVVDSNQSVEWNTRHIDRNMGLLIHIHDLFINAFKEAASGTLSYDDAVARLNLL
ncbi:hypothetical protein [Ammoniphilus resinae]|uniref:Uncharacterized protein n=1 Tax=Ammoniphilus resinae TaxID=861532 RepID=A0ABS4GPT0_9BACL|nr:hypothetical protein [Ammoniphilus resinae]MBP1932279.1 hypothetical protein [Ammoniphilus resinae]